MTRLPHGEALRPGPRFAARLVGRLLLSLCVACASWAYAKTAVYPEAPAAQTAAQAQAKSAGCASCHTQTDRPTMHQNPGVVLGCTDCHGGDARVDAHGLKRGEKAYEAALEKAHVLPRYPKAWHWPSSANPKRSYTLLNREAPEYIRFVNPGDYRVAREACGACHLADRPGRRAQPDGDLGDALGRGGVQQRHAAVQELHPGRGLHARRRAGEVPRRATAGNARSVMVSQGRPAVALSACPPGRWFRPPTSSASSSAAAR